MAYFPHYLLQFGGHQGDSNESWSCGIRLAIYDGPDPIDLDTDEEQYLDDTAVPALTTWFQAPLTRILVACKLLTVKFNRINASGNYTESGPTHIRQVNLSGGAAGPTNVHPLQVAYVLSWHTNEVARGPGSHGRIYVPRPMIQVNDAGDISGSDRVDLAEQGADLIMALDTSSGLPPAAVIRPSIVSNITGTPPRQIDFVTVDSSLDIQRRRSRSQSKEISSAAATY